jgi:excisionase family DNA binding protein
MEIGDFYTVDETAKVLKTDSKTVYGAILKKQIPAVRVGRLLRIPGAWLRRSAEITEAGDCPISPQGTST